MHKTLQRQSSYQSSQFNSVQQVKEASNNGSRKNLKEIYGQLGIGMHKGSVNYDQAQGKENKPKSRQQSVYERLYGQVDNVNYKIQTEKKKIIANPLIQKKSSNPFALMPLSSMIQKMQKNKVQEKEQEQEIYEIEQNKIEFPIKQCFFSLVDVQQKQKTQYKAINDKNNVKQRKQKTHPQNIGNKLYEYILENY